MLAGAAAIALDAGKARADTHLILLSLTLVENSVALLFRRRHPVRALVGVLAVYTVFALPPAMVLPVLVALFTVASLRPGRVLALATVGAAAAVVGRPSVQGGPLDFAGQQLPLLLAIGLAVSRGMYTRFRYPRTHPRVLIAGSCERRALPLVARYADACNIRTSSEIPRQLVLLARLCDEAGRDFAAIEKTAPYFFDVGQDGSKVSELLDQLPWLAGMGIETVFGWVVGVDRIEPIENMGRQVIPAAAEFGAAHRG